MGMVNPTQLLFALRLTPIILLIPGETHSITTSASAPYNSISQVAIGSIISGRSGNGHDFGWSGLIGL